MSAPGVHSEDDILACLRRAFAAGHDRKHTYEDNAPKQGYIAVDTIISRFGSWSKAVLAIGETPGDGPDHGMARGSGCQSLSGAPSSPPASAHLWTVEDASGSVIFREHTYPGLDFLKKHRVLPVSETGCAIVRVDYQCAA